MLSTTPKRRRRLREGVLLVRRQLSFWNELHFTKLSSLRAHIYLEVLRETLEHLHFYAVVVRRSAVDVRASYGGQWYRAYNDFTRLLLERFTRRGLSARVYVDFKNRQQRDDGIAYLHETVNSSKPGALLSVEPVDSKADDLMQLTDLCLGLVRYGFEVGYPLLHSPRGMPDLAGRKGKFYCDAAHLIWDAGKQGRFRIVEWEPPRNGETGP